jgi:hypothetical protein
MESQDSTEREGTTAMATKKITPVNPDTKATDEAEAKDTAVERKTAGFIKVRKSARKTSSIHVDG